MCNITLIFTKHKEHGICNSNELYNIFVQIRPEVIFEEIPPSRHDAYYKEHGVSILETNAVKKYKQEYNIKNIPVDKNYDINEIKEQYDNSSHLDDIIFGNSVEYCNLWEKNLEMTYLYGFEYFNCIKYTELSEKLHQIERNIIRNLNVLELLNKYKMWINNINERENEMIQNIYNYSKENNFKNAIFTIGAEHKISIIKKLTNIKEEKNINWIYDIF